MYVCMEECMRACTSAHVQAYMHVTDINISSVCA